MSSRLFITEAAFAHMWHFLFKCSVKKNEYTASFVPLISLSGYVETIPNATVVSYSFSTVAPFEYNSFGLNFVQSTENVHLVRLVPFIKYVQFVLETILYPNG